MKWVRRKTERFNECLILDSAIGRSGSAKEPKLQTVRTATMPYARSVELASTTLVMLIAIVTARANVFRMLDHGRHGWDPFCKSGVPTRNGSL